MTLEQIFVQVRCPHSWDVNTAERCNDCRTIVMRTLDVMGYTLMRVGASESGREGVGLPTKEHAPPPFPYSR